MKVDILNILLRGFCLLLLVGSSPLSLAQEPQIQSIDGVLKEGAEVTIKGADFTYKANPGPLLFWSADGGVLPSSLGRKKAWDGTFNGLLVDQTTSQIIAPGSKKSLRYDYSTGGGALLARVSFDSDQLYVWRKRYDDFDRAKDFGIRTRYKQLEKLGAASGILVGMLMSTPDKSILGKVIKSEVSSISTGTVYYSNEYGNIFNRSLGRAVENGSTFYFYDETDTELKTPLLKVLSDEGSGIFYTFNHKIFRLWGKFGTHLNNSYISLDSDGMMVSERTQVKSFFMKDWDSQIASATNRWVVEEFQYQAGTLNQEDGTLLYWQDRVQAWNSKRFRFTTLEYPNKYSDLYQTQVSNGAQPESFEYFDSLYVDDTWHRVFICAEKTLFACKQPEILIPTEWSDIEIKANLRLGSLREQDRYYFYIVNGAGVVNAVGFSSCPKCPEPPLSLE